MQKRMENRKIVVIREFILHFFIGTQVKVGLGGLHKLWPFQKGMFSITEIGKIVKKKKIRMKEMLLGIFYIVTIRDDTLWN